MMSVGYVESSSTVHVLHANTLATTVHCVSPTSPNRARVSSGVKNRHSDWQMRTLLSHGTDLINKFPRALEDDAEYQQHCLLTWIQQDSSKGLCPMCRQSMAYSTLTTTEQKLMTDHGGRIRVEAKRRVDSRASLYRRRNFSI